MARQPAAARRGIRLTLRAVASRGRAQAVLCLALAAVACERDASLAASTAPLAVGSKPANETMLASSAEHSASATTPEAVEESASVIQSIERYGAKDSARVVVTLNRAVSYELGELAAEGGRGPRIFIDLPAVTWQGAAVLPVGGLVAQVRTGEREGGIRLVLDLTEPARKRVFYLPEPFRLVIDVSSDSEEVVRRRLDPRRISRVVLDPGHGGHDPGAIGASGLREKDVALDVAHRAAPLIARELGISTLLTRDDDTFVALDERVAKANAFGADLFISIHCNASPSSDSHGIMTFVLDSSRDSLAEQVAARENSGTTVAAKTFASAMREVMDTEAVQVSVRFAKLLQRSSLASLSSKYPAVVDGGVRRAGFYVLAGAHMPAVLFEASFISNPTEELRLDSGGYRQRLADALVNAVRAYKSGLGG